MMQPIEFRAPWSKSLRTLTALSLLILAVVTLLALTVPVQEAPFVRTLILLLTLSLALGALPFMVRGYVLTEDAILVKRLGWSTRLPLQGLKTVAGDVEALRGAWRLFGNGGLYSFTGLFWNRRLGRYRAFATNPKNAVVLRSPARTVVVTPESPREFLHNLAACGHPATPPGEISR